jgi:hypothetical protein
MSQPCCLSYLRAPPATASCHAAIAVVSRSGWRAAGTVLWRFAYCKGSPPDWQKKKLFCHVSCTSVGFVACFWAPVPRRPSPHGASRLVCPARSRCKTPSAAIVVRASPSTPAAFGFHPSLPAAAEDAGWSGGQQVLALGLSLSRSRPSSRPCAVLQQAIGPFLLEYISRTRVDAWGSGYAPAE